MLEVEKVKKLPKRHAPSGSVSPMTRPQSPAAIVTSGSNFNTRATSTSCGRGRGAQGDLPEMEVKVEFVDVEEKANSGHRKVTPSGSQKGSERDLLPRRKRPRLLSRGSSIPSPDQAFLEEEEEGALGLRICSRKRRACSLWRPGFYSAASRAKSQASPGRNKPKGDSEPCVLKSVLGQEPSVQPEKKVSRQKAHGRRGVRQPARKKSRDPVLSSGLAPPTPVLVQATSPDRTEVGQPSESEETRQADILIACLDREVRRLKKWKERRLLSRVGEKSSLLSSQKPPGLKKLARTIKETKGWASQGCSPGARDTTDQKLTLDVSQLFTPGCETMCHVTCTLCHPSTKHGLERERRPVTASPDRAGAVGTHKCLRAGAPSLVQEGISSSGHCPSGLPPEDNDGQLAPGRREQLFLAPPPLPAPIKDKPTAPPAAVMRDQEGPWAPSQPRSQGWDQSIAELLCSLALPLSFLSSPPFRRFMAQVDPDYCLPSPATFSDEALPLLHKVMGQQVRQEMRRAEGSRVHLAMCAAAQEVVVGDYVAVTAHWGVIQRSSWQVVPGSLRKQAVLWVRGLPLESTAEDRQRELREQVRLWLGHGSLRPGFLVSNGCPSLEPTVTVEGYTHIPCFAYCLSSVVRNFLRHHDSVQVILSTARALCSHFQGSAEARRLLMQLQRQCGLPAHQPFWELSDHWVSTYHLMEWLVEQEQPLREYEEKHQQGKARMGLSATFWSLANSLVLLLRPFQMVVQEASAPQASLSQVLPQLRYLHIFLEQVPAYFEEQGSGETGAAVRLARGLALQLSADCQLSELFHHEEFVLATLLDPRFKGQLEAILPVGADIDHWMQVLVYKVKEIMVSEYPLPPSPFLQSRKAMSVDTTWSSRIVKGLRAKGRGLKDPLQRSGNPRCLLLGQREKSLLEQLESVGLLASQRSGASLSTENHQATVIVRKYLREKKPVGAREDPLAYWEKKREVWPALARLATIYLSCPATSASAGRVLASLDSPAIMENSPPLPLGTVEHLLSLKTNLENFPNYTPSPLTLPGGDVAEGEQTREPGPRV